MLIEWKFCRTALLTLAALGALMPLARAQEILVKSGQKIAFMGDSITEQGTGESTGERGSAHPLGYVNMVIIGLAANDIKAEALPAGHGGHKSNDMLIRLNDEVINRKPDWMTLSCGVNDVWHGAKGVPLDQYKSNITQIVDKAQAANIKVILLTSTMITENQADVNNQKLVAYNDFLKAFAAERKLPLADLNADMQAALAATPHQGNMLTVDGVHMNTAGNMMMAQGVLKAFGLNAAQLAKARDAWLDIPGAVSLGFGATVSQREYDHLRALAAQQNLSLDEMLRAEFAKMVAALLKQK